EPAPGENIFINLAPGEPFTFAFDLAAPGVYADRGPNGEIIIHVPHSDAGQGEQAYGHVIITGITPQEFTAATGEPVQGTIPESGIPELRDPNDQASFRHVSELFAFLGLIGFTEAGTLFETFLSYLFPDFEQDEDDEFEILCLFTPNDDIVDFDDV